MSIVHKTSPIALLRTLAAASVFAALIGVSGCMAIAPLARSAELHGDHEVTAKYAGLDSKSFAVVVAADRSIQATYPQLIGQVTATVSERLKQHVNASGWVPPDAVLAFQFQHPQWSTWTMDKLAKELGVQRLVFIDIQEFRLNEPGNEYLWKGTASCLVGVLEADGAFPDAFAFQEHATVTFPTKETALSPSQASASDVQIALAKRVIDRAAWMFYTHDEANVIDY